MYPDHFAVKTQLGLCSGLKQEVPLRKSSARQSNMESSEGGETESQLYADREKLVAAVWLSEQ